jgi:hypothetical protein
MEQEKENLSLSKVNQLLLLFGHVLGPVKEISINADTFLPNDQANNKKTANN